MIKKDQTRYKIYIYIYILEVTQMTLNLAKWNQMTKKYLNASKALRMNPDVLKITKKLATLIKIARITHNFND